MNLKKVVIQLSIPDVQQILRISMDNEEHEAFVFIKEILAKRVKEALQPH